MWPFCSASVDASAASAPVGRPRSSATPNTWRARIPGPVVMSMRFSAYAARSSSTTGSTASRPRSMIERPPIATTCSHGNMRMIGRSVAGITSSRSSSVWRMSADGTSLAAKRSGLWSVMKIS